MNLINTSDRIFIAGHQGMVGSSIVRTLKGNNFKNLLLASRKDLDLRNFKDVEKWFKNNYPDVVIICAAKVGGILANSNYPADFLLENLKIQNNIIEISWKENVKRLLFLGSSCIYPKFSKQPISENDLLTGALEPTNEPYAIAKISGLKLCQTLRKQYGFDAFSVMPTNLYGPGDNYHKLNSHVIPAFIRRFCEASDNNEKIVRCWGTGKPLREFLHVDDLSKACLFLLQKWNPKQPEFSYINIGSGNNISIKEVANIISHYSGFDGEIFWDYNKPDGTPAKKLDLTKINELGWKPSIEFKEGIKDTVSLFRKEYKRGALRL